jgi:hypothetical protein|nr:MAG TPA: NinG recombination protein [Caudoviricetes sp.]
MIKKRYKKLDYNTEDLESLSSSDLKKIADYSLRQYLLKHNGRDDGMYRCPLKKQWYQKDRIHVAHFHDRNRLNTRYNLDNCHLISEQSNVWESQVPYEGYKSRHHYEYEIWLREEIGEEKFEKLLQDSKQLCIFTKSDYIELINKFRNE